MRRWLNTVGGRGDFGLLGFLLAFGFQYHWGFISHGLAIPLAFGYLTAFERQGNRPGWRAMVKALLFAVALFFCHGITFGFCTLVVVVRLLLRWRPLEAWRAGVHALPVGLLAVYWSRLHPQRIGETGGDEWFDLNRLTTLFSGPFTAYPNRGWALVSLIGLTLVLVATRPRLVLQVRRVAPLAVSLLLFVSLPETVAATWLIGTRCCAFVHAFAPAAVQPRTTGWLGRLWPRVVLAWVVLALVSLNVRLSAYDHETAGLHELTKHMQHGLDVYTMLPVTGYHSETMGPAQFAQVAAWVTAECGGILDNESSGYYQMPIQRGELPSPSYYRYIIARGNPSEVTRKVTEKWPAAHLVYAAGAWLLFENPPAGNGDFTVLRALQSWGPLTSDRGLSDAPLTIAGRSFAHGLGTHADSFIRVQIDRPGRALTGACGIDDAGGPLGRAMFRIRDDDGEVLFESGEVRGDESARRFSVPLGARKQLILEVGKVETIHFAHADWVDLKIAW
jgi:hypothetical protein